MLASCDNEEGGTSDKSTDVVVTDDWKVEEKQAMNDILGFELPYFNIEGATFGKDEENLMIFVTMDSGATKDTLLTIEKAFKADPDFTVEYEVGGIEEQPNYGEYSYNGIIEIKGFEYIGHVQYGIYTTDDDFGVAEEGALEFAAYLQKNIVDNSAVYNTYGELLTATKTYFTNEGLNAELPETLSITAESYEFYDLRYAYFDEYRRDIGPYMVMYLNGALETDVEKVTKDFTDLGYVLTQYTFGGYSYESYVKGDVAVDITFEEANTENDLPQAVTVTISEFVQDAE